MSRGTKRPQEDRLRWAIVGGRAEDDRREEDDQREDEVLSSSSVSYGRTTDPSSSAEPRDD